VIGKIVLTMLVAAAKITFSTVSAPNGTQIVALNLPIFTAQ
jgi:hypothetical protein